MTHTEIVKKLLGNIKPVGETNEDNKRLDNLNEYTELAENLIEEILEVAKHSNRTEFSIKQLGLRAQYFITTLKDRLDSK